MSSKRIWEIDFLRGIAIILMVLFHLFYDLNEFCGFDIDYTRGLIDVIGNTSALTFIILTGISSSLSRSNLKRGLKILAYALLITIITYLYDSATYINFGILHLIGTSIILYPFFRKIPSPGLALLSFIIIFIGDILSNQTISHNYLAPLGLTSTYYTALDYYPLFPYFGFFLLGIILGNILYPRKNSIFKFSLAPNNPINFLGRHSLFIYITHQPIILAILFLMSKMRWYL